jgi:putative oxidoreductase
MKWRDRLLAGGLLWLRLLMGFGIASHGYQKIFGGRMDQFTEGVATLGFLLPGFFAWAAALSEFVGGLLIVVGLGTRVAALCVFISMSVAAFIRHAADPFRVKELALAYWTIASSLLLTGPGALSVDALIHRWRPSRKSRC